MFLLIYPLMVLQFKHHGIWVCINLNHAAHYFSGYFYLSSCSPILYMYWLSTVHIVCLCKHSSKLHMYTVQAYKMIAISATSAIWVLGILIVKFVQIKTHLQIQCNHPRLWESCFKEGGCKAGFFCKIGLYATVSEQWFRYNFSWRITLLMELLDRHVTCSLEWKKTWTSLFFLLCKLSM